MKKYKFFRIRNEIFLIINWLKLDYFSYMLNIKLNNYENKWFIILIDFHIKIKRVISIFYWKVTTNIII